MNRGLETVLRGRTGTVATGMVEGIARDLLIRARGGRVAGRRGHIGVGEGLHGAPTRTIGSSRSENRERKKAGGFEVEIRVLYG